MAIHRVGSVYHTVSAGTDLVDIKQQVDAASTHRFRRIDRFVQMALLGSCRCVEDLPLDPQTALYLATGRGPAANNIAIQEEILRERNPPMPIRFINAVSNSVCFYVMKNFGLEGQNLLVSRDLHAFEAALECAITDLETGIAPQALIGMVDEVTHPVEDQCRRFKVPVTTALGEGSHWFLVSLTAGNSDHGYIRSRHLHDSVDDMMSWLSRHEFDPSLAIFTGQGIEKPLRERVRSRVGKNAAFVDVGEAHWDGRNAGAIAQFLSSPTASELLVISADSDGRYQTSVVSTTQCARQPLQPID